MFGKRLRSVRMERKYTQPQMADFIGVALRTYQGYEGETRFPSFETIVRLADILDVSLDYLFGRDDFMKAHAISADEYL